MPHNTKQTKIGEQEEDHLERVTNLVIDLVNAPAYALFMVYKKYKRLLEGISKDVPKDVVRETLQAICDMLKVALERQGIDADSEKL